MTAENYLLLRCISRISLIVKRTAERTLVRKVCDLSVKRHSISAGLRSFNTIALQAAFRIISSIFSS
ncbi:MAG: hypothetical protein A2469_01155 [Candidatus Magasanikbacteria bacterium RIFOXYC2_FULL_40_16]|uniref:Uncharacterized protein n=1 Tax=Candidatus Magasanikbacteria bacterium RIFOXYC2_FULL_40_16 TaxID=1798703 RepID=A0A1F6P0W1_9BACT|nr:MAG: hypothetical protein A2224_02190 [Candidatus Magasanikbacteria bacterium RIFOXYA2_FULL_40_20]OGH89806.1 MAG: hypothetical protein A2469_01155 [Candidatus Magasanikbacteria bacterium RIFOXYC2_FULL_40_16]